MTRHTKYFTTGLILVSCVLAGCSKTPAEDPTYKDAVVSEAASKENPSAKKESKEHSAAKKKADNVEMGRYVETNIELPKLEKTDLNMNFTLNQEDYGELG